jgi:hypothetical protein
MSRKLIGVAVEQWPMTKKFDALAWLIETYGQDKMLWYIDTQPLMEDLVMVEEVFTMFALRWISNGIQ